MIANIKEFDNKLGENSMERHHLAEQIQISVSELNKKLETVEGDFLLSEMVKIAQIMKMNAEEFISIFFGEKVSFNENSDQKPESA